MSVLATIDAQDALFARHRHFNSLRSGLAAGPVLRPERYASWSAFWTAVRRRLGDAGYAPSTQRLYRQVLRALRAFGAPHPRNVDARLVQAFVSQVSARRGSWSWTAMNICVLRTVFDGLCGMAICDRLATPRRRESLPEILSEGEVLRIVRAGACIRDQVLLGLLYGCALSPGELRALRWSDITTDAAAVHVRASARYRERTLTVPVPLQEILAEGKALCEPADFLFRGCRAGRPLSCRALELIFRRAVRAAGVFKSVTPLAMRHSYAVHRLEAGVSLREVQDELGHASIATTERYGRCVLPAGLVSPLREVRNLLGEDTPAGPAPAPPAASFATLRPLRAGSAALPFPRGPRRGSAALFHALLKSRFLRGLFRRAGPPL